jgi:hypothetical protein
MTVPVRAGTSLRRSLSVWQAVGRLAAGLRDLDEHESEVLGG